MLDFSRKVSPAASLRSTLTALIDTAIVERQKAEYEAGRGSGQGLVAKKRIGAGYIGEPCVRALAYRYHRFPRDVRDPDEKVFVTPGELQRHALSGFWTEGALAEWLVLASVDLRTVDYSQPVGEDGKYPQFGYRVAPHPVTGQAQIAGEVDGMIFAVPPALEGILPAPCIWESKKATAKKFATFVKGGVKGADPKYFAQVQTNMGYLDVHHTLFSMLNLDTMEMYFELVAFDLPYAEALVNRAATVLASQSPNEFDRIARESTDFRCKFCDWRPTCWRRNVEPAVNYKAEMMTGPRPPDSRPSWMVR